MKKLIIILLMLAGSAHAKDPPITKEQRVSFCKSNLVLAQKKESEIKDLYGQPSNLETGHKFGFLRGWIMLHKHSYIYYSCDVELWNGLFPEEQITQRDVDLNVIMFRENWR